MVDIKSDLSEVIIQCTLSK